MSLATLFKKLGAEHGVEIDEEELAQLGLADEDEILPGLPGGESVSDLDEVLSGEAAGAVEIFLSDPRSMLADGKAIESGDGLMWEPIIREGQWAVRPGANGQKRRRPLRVVAGHSKNQRKEIGLADIKAAFDDEAIEHVTVPTSHDNKVTENTGFIKALKIVKGQVKDKATKKMKDVAVLMGGYDIRLPEIKRKMDLGTIASRSAGLLYDYVNTETGKTYGVVLEHVALTNKPWITGMKAFGRKLVKTPAVAPVGLSLSDDDPDEGDLLADEGVLETISLADSTAITWDKEDDPDWLRGQINDALSEARAKKVAALKAQMPPGSFVYDSYDYPKRYRCAKARPGKALICDGWGDGANYWTVPFTIVDGEVSLEEDLSKWQASKEVFVPDEARKAFEEGEEPLADEPKEPEKASEPEPEVRLSRIQRARLARRARGTKNSPEPTTAPDQNEPTTHPRGGEHMAGENGTLQLSDEAQRLIQAAEDRAKAAEEKAAASDQKVDRLSQQVATLLGDRTVSMADANVAELKRMGFTEDKGFSGVLVELRNLFSADDGEPAVQGDKFSTDDNAEGTLSLSDALMRVFRAFEKGEDGKVKFGESITQPATPPGDKKGEGENKDESSKLGDDGKPPASTEEDKAFESLSEDEQIAQLAKDNPEMFKAMRLPVPSANGDGQKGGE